MFRKGLEFSFFTNLHEAPDTTRGNRTLTTNKRASRSLLRQVYLGVVLEPKTPPRRPKMPPKTPRRGKTPPRRPKTPPRRAKTRPRRPTKLSRRPQDTKTPSRGPKTPPRPPKIPPRPLKTAPGSAQEPPEVLINWRGGTKAQPSTIDKRSVHQDQRRSKIKRNAWSECDSSENRFLEIHLRALPP